MDTTPGGTVLEGNSSSIGVQFKIEVEGAGEIRRQQGSVVREGHSVVELTLARLVDEAALVLGPARAALPGAVLPLQHFSTQSVAFCALPGPLQPAHLARLLQEHGPRRHGGSRVVQGPGLPAGGCQLSAGTEQRLSGRGTHREKALASPT